ncbi:MAG: CDP-alcohol phosphatidyltransferase family protein [Chloracidobacterium sp.]|nr:CDP-alcohol phosphatidyltransferase family protein [Chloracidobacterium sp.]
MTSTAVLFVNSQEQFEGQTLACFRITDVPLVKRNVIDLRRAGFATIFVVMDERTAELEAVLDDIRRTSFQRCTFSDTDWRDAIRTTCDDDVLVFTSDRLSEYRLLHNFATMTPGNGFDSVIAVDIKDIDSPSNAERRFHLNDGQVITDEEFAAIPIARELGLYRMPAADVASFESPEPEYIAERAAAYRKNGRVELFEVGNGFVEKIESRDSVRRAERRLIRYIWKSTDGMYARRNKRILKPILPYIFKTPITPNMVSLIGVIVSIYSGYLFSRGGYFYGVVAALVTYLSALLDHVDGAIARIKSKESDFGAHFDTLCDYVFYVSFGLGVTAGLYRASGNPFYIWLGVAALFGTITSLIMTSYARNTRATNASTYAAEAHKKYETRSQVTRIGRRIYFVIRRPVVPYFIIFFSIVHLLPFVLFMTALSANLFWMFHVYTNTLFSPVKKLKSDRE